jgi:hypothetical protein
MHGNNKDGEIVVFGLEGFDEVEAVAVAQSDIDDEEIRLEIGDGFQSGLGVGDFTTDFDEGTAIDHLVKAFKEKRMVIHQEDAALFKRFGHTES